ncbi:MAG: hypothetical protein HOM68_13765 [Gemmatimonadetes bacterium]|jgi:hypothetical protein|nr:hypothetical protein [Gemmatimonadota bacterium]MBT4610466.1 hypothetical protein [Gemmatimonadota bacterium]MBT5057605.1 hypothetical protein [Gemmatimonadota bacterium]MBT5142661.1 hypothetical protein [Gemmatimonadota bacterium]MBT5587637.1 hypothetical protein [Gemmatimonadota bacterium]
MQRFVLLSLAASLSALTPVMAQSLELRAHQHSSGPVTAGIGDTVQIDVVARLDCLGVSGIDLHLSLPTSAFEVIDHSPEYAGIQPFSKGSLFDNVVTAYNGISDVPEVVAEDRTHFRYAALAGLGDSRVLKGDGLVASFEVVVQGTLNHAEVRIEDTPILETRLVLPDGTTERRFVSLNGIDVSTGLFLTAIEEGSWAQVKGAVD